LYPIRVVFSVHNITIEKGSLMRKGKLSLVIPLYCEGEHFSKTFAVIRETVEQLPEAYLKGWECVLVDDGSTDSTWQSLESLARDYPEQVRALRFSRNFGKEAAIRAGLEHASGDLAIVMDGDLQHPPSLMEDMVGLWADHDIDVVNAVKADRGRESLLYRFFVSCFNFLMTHAAGQHVVGDSDYKLIDRKVIDAFLKLGERRTFFRGLINWMGFRSATIPLQVQERAAGETKFKVRSLVRLGLTALTSFSTIALHFVTALGILSALVSALLGLYTLGAWWSGRAVEGFTTIILLQLMVGSIIMVALGIIGEYLSIIYIEVKGRPHYFLAESIQPEKKNNLES